MGHLLKKPQSNHSFPSRLFAAALLLTGVVLAGLGWGAYRSYHFTKMTKEQYLRMEELRGVITHLDEVLTMSARMAAVTRDLIWEKRYRKFEPQLDAAIKEAISLAPHALSTRAAAQTDAANIKLVEMENRAFALVHRGRAEEASAILFGKDYAAQKRIYSEGMSQFTSALQELTEAALNSQRQQAMLTFAVVVAALLILLFTWFVVLRTMDRYITEGERAEEALSKAHSALGETTKYLASLIESSTDAIIAADGDGKVSLFNKGAEDLLGYRREEVMDRHVPLLYENVHQAKEVMRRMRQGGGSVSALETTLRAKDSTLIPVLISASILYDKEGNEAGTVGFNKDLRGRKRAEEQIHKLSRTVEQSPSTATITDTDGNIEYVNPKFTEVTGYTSEEVIGKNPRILKSGETLTEEYKRLWETITAGGEWRGEFHNKKKSGELYWELASISPLRGHKGDVTHFIKVGEDITDRKRAEEALERAHDDLKQAYDTLEKAQATAIAGEKLAAIGRLTAGVSHEVLNPLNIITLIIQRLLDDSDINPDLAEDLRGIEVQSNRITKIAQDLLYFSRHRSPERRPIDFNETVRRTLALLDYDLRLQNIDMELKLADELPFILADQDQIQQVILTLLTNARDVMPKGGRLALSTSEAEPLSKDKDRAMEFRIQDSGPGIAPEQMEKLFDPFYTTKEEGKGTGLGLSICQGIIESHGGTIWAENIPGGGAAFVVRLGMGDEDAA